jgi:hypothetical protein
MSAIVELQDRIQSTNALIAEHERAIALSGKDAPGSVVANIRALEKLQRRLEREYFQVAAQLELEVYRYRILNDSDRPTLAGIAHAWVSFQEFFGSVYSSLTRSGKNKRKKPVGTETLDLGYGYSFASSVGVVVTVPKEIGIYAVSPIEQASSVVFDLIEAKEVERHARLLGPAPIRALHKWIEVHLTNHYGLGLEWRSGNAIQRSVEVQYPALGRLQATIVNTTTQTGIDIQGELFWVNTDTKEFGIHGDDGNDYEGTFADAIAAEHAASIPARYKAHITRTTKIIVLGGEAETSLFLDRLDFI